jgi:hypothetical protein
VGERFLWENLSFAERFSHTLSRELIKTISNYTPKR